MCGCVDLEKRDNESNKSDHENLEYRSHNPITTQPKTKNQKQRTNNMKALILEGINQPLTYTDVEMPTLQAGEVLVKINAAAFNHRDYWIQKGQYGGLRFPSIQGSDGCGVVDTVFDDENKHWIGKEVVINPSLNWGNNPNTQAKDYIILGMAQDGTFAEYVKVHARLLHEKPAHLSAQQAAAFPLAGLTGFRALMTRAAAKPGDTVLITGAGGGVALFCVQFAIALGCNVYVTSGSDEKIAKAITSPNGVETLEKLAKAGKDRKKIGLAFTELQQVVKSFDEEQE